MFRNAVILINNIIVIFFVRFVLFSTFHVYHAILFRSVIKECRLMHFNIVLTYSFDLHALNQNLLLSLQSIIDLSTSFQRSCKHLLFIFCFQFASLYLKCNSKIIFNFDAFFRHFHFMHVNNE